MELKELPFNLTHLLGAYTIIPCKKDAKLTEKMKAIKSGIKMLIKEVSTWGYIPDFNTMQFIVHEGIYSKIGGLDLYCDEKYEKIDDAEEVITVGIKFNGIEKRNNTTERTNHE